MKAKIAVVTISGKAYYLVVSELKKKKVPFFSLTPNERIPIEVKVVITTEEERPLIKHEKVLTLKDGMEPEALINQVMQVAQGKECYEEIVVGIDPGEAFGLAVLADGKVVETGNCFSIEETLDKIKSILKNFKSDLTSSISVKIGDGVPECKDKLLQALDNTLPSNVSLEIVGEAGTNRHMSGTKHRRGLRDIVSAVKIAGRTGYTFTRRKSDEPND
ncbi:hypothetical protein KAU92_02775 [Candidatus Bathyarchaeota archaeon]|nr:hypothetical protein [Candidatus Bathyarchaeota archaeon]